MVVTSEALGAWLGICLNVSWLRLNPINIAYNQVSWIASAFYLSATRPVCQQSWKQALLARMKCQNGKQTQQPSKVVIQK